MDSSKKDSHSFVFISYNHEDVKWAKWLQRKLEWYRLPTEIHNEFSDSRYIRPVFRDRDNLNSGILNDKLKDRLETSRFLVVICSPHSAASEWVSDEIKAFIEMGRLERIIPFIVNGNPQDYSRSPIETPLMNECFPLALRQWNQEHPDKNLLGIAVKDDGENNKQKAFIRLVSYLIGVDFDVLWQRHKRFIRRIAIFLALLTIAMAGAAYWFMAPIRLSVDVRDEASRLPGMEQGTLYINGGEYSFSRPDTILKISAILGFNRMKQIPLRFHADRFYQDEEILIPLGAGIRQQATLQLHRDESFAWFAGYVYEGGHDSFEGFPLAGAKVNIDHYSVLTDAAGHFEICLPLNEQEEYKSISISKDKYHPCQREDESPSTHLIFLLHKE